MSIPSAPRCSASKRSNRAPTVARDRRTDGYVVGRLRRCRGTSAGGSGIGTTGGAAGTERSAGSAPDGRNGWRGRSRRDWRTGRHRARMPDLPPMAVLTVQGKVIDSRRHPHPKLQS
jgi:hypothetical protein